MSRQHFWTFTCNRCGKQQTAPSKSGENTPPGWSVVKRVWFDWDLCDACSAAYTSHVDEFFKDPPIETHTVVDDDLEEMDPETHPEDDNPHPDGPR